MHHHIIDRRLNGKNKSSVNRQRFLRRVKEQVKDAVKRIIQDGKIEDVVSNKQERIDIPVKDINEPFFHHDRGGVVERVFPGNKEFIKGDQLRRQNEQGEGKGKGEGSPDGEGEDDFSFSISRDEFLDFFFEDLELPDLVKTQLATISDHAYRRAGFVTDGNPSRLNVVRSMKQATARRLALRNPKRKKLRDLEEKLDVLLGEHYNAIHATPFDQSIVDSLQQEIDHIMKEIEVLRKRIKAVPFIDEMDLRYHNYVKVPVPTTQAVMFCIMDVSGSMGEFEKDVAKRFFMLLYLFLTKSYERIDLVFIRHHSEAAEVTQEEFFHSRESGGTVVSPALELMYQIITERYNTSQWNVYGCQASDGDNVSSDTASVEKSIEKILPIVQYFAYLEIGDNDDSYLWKSYDHASAAHKNFSRVKISEISDIYPVFRKLFEKKP